MDTINDLCWELDETIIPVHPEQSNELLCFQQYEEYKKRLYSQLKHTTHKKLILNKFPDWLYMMSVLLEHKYNVCVYRNTDGYSFTALKEISTSYFLFEFVITIANNTFLDSLADTVQTFKNTQKIYNFYLEVCLGNNNDNSNSSI